MAAPSLYDDDDIVDARRSSSHSSSGSSSSSSSHHHHHHRHSTANARLQRSADRYVGADAMAQTLYRWALLLIVLAGAGVGGFLGWQKYKQLKFELANREGTNVVLAERIAKLEADQKNLLLEIQSLERDKEELSEMNKALRETLASAIGGISR
ncbi:MAG: hypothetical protein ILM98_14675 [Kiritimatiellae bacterium]|nr:hypothetical protein [Kiritimatiellia bacterium]